jgi:hypothetical protein
MSTYNTELHKAVYNHDPEKVRWLLSAKATPIKKGSSLLSMHAMFVSDKTSEKAQIVSLLIENKADIGPVLIQAARRSTLYFSVLLQCKPSAVLGCERELLDMCVGLSHFEHLWAIAEAGANINCMLRQGDTLLHRLLSKYHEFGNHFITTGQRSPTEEMLIERTIKIVLRHGGAPSLSVRNKFGHTPVFLAKIAYSNFRFCGESVLDAAEKYGLPPFQKEDHQKDFPMPREL